MREISGMDEVSFQPGAGGQAVLAAGAMARAYHRARGQDEERNQIDHHNSLTSRRRRLPGAMGYEVDTLVA